MMNSVRHTVHHDISKFHYWGYFDVTLLLAESTLCVELRRTTSAKRWFTMPVLLNYLNFLFLLFLRCLKQAWISDEYVLNINKQLFNQGFNQSKAWGSGFQFFGQPVLSSFISQLTSVNTMGQFIKDFMISWSKIWENCSGQFL